MNIIHKGTIMDPSRSNRLIHNCTIQLWLGPGQYNTNSKKQFLYFDISLTKFFINTRANQ